jgi:hypothetical protein
MVSFTNRSLYRRGKSPPPPPIHSICDWRLRLVRTLWRRKEPRTPAGNLTMIPLSSRQQPSHYTDYSIFSSSNGLTALVGLGPLIIEASRFNSFRHTTLGRTPLDEWSVRCRVLYLTTHSTHKRQTSMPPVGFEPAIPASERLQTHALDGAATGIGLQHLSSLI